MRLHQYPGLFDEGAGRGLVAAVAISLALHIGLFAAFGRFHIARVDRTFYAPIHMVDLVDKTPGTGGGAKSEAPAKPEAKPAPPPPPPPVKKPATETSPAAVKAPPKPTPSKPPPPKPAPKEKVISTETTSPAPTEPLTEERVAERIARLREKLSPPQPAAPEASGPPTGMAESKVRQAVESIRSRVQPGEGNGSGTGGKSGTGALGVRGGAANVLQEVRLRNYYNQLWEHVNAHWTIPPSLEGKGYTVIVSAVVDRRGRVLKAAVEEPSVSAAFDQSALRALERASPLPEFPDEVKEDVLEVGFRFHGE